MIVQELLDENTVRTYSDKRCYIYGGFPKGYYVEAISPLSEHRQYIETDIPIEITNDPIKEKEEKEKFINREEERIRVLQEIKEKMDMINNN